MKPQIISREEIIEENGKEEQATRLYFSQDGIHEINLRNLFKDQVGDCEVTECFWLDDKETILLVNYIDWSSSELWALVNTKGVILKKGLWSVESHNEEHGFSIVIMSGWGMGDERYEYNISDDDTRWAVLDKFGNYIIEPTNDKIIYEEEENALIITNYDIDEYYNLEGEFIKEVIKHTY
jgi:hypothetical protein